MITILTKDFEEENFSLHQEAEMAIGADFVKITPKACEEVKKLVAAEGNSDIGLRLGVKGGGCSGFNFTLDVVEGKTDADESWDYDGVTVICDPRSYIYLKGTTVDFKDEL
ncbi:MAG: iron-sulfur cluster assembly accessory protein, partial [Nitrospinae bacterium]|nr:iron-sulfur cluster assembly accessory protein [Nitrospinota bacterium]